MCGIVGYVGDRQAAEFLLEGLSKLEYRGYDSAGIAVYDGERRIARFKREHMAPGEMENVAIPAMFLKTITGGPLSVRIEED